MLRDVLETKYTSLGDAQIAYQVFGEGPIDVVYCQGTVGGSVDTFWDHPVPARFMEHLGTFSRVIMFNTRGSGVSDRLPDDRSPTWEDWAEDFGVVLDAVGGAGCLARRWRRRAHRNLVRCPPPRPNFGPHSLQRDR